jgi:hypothetical protein
MFTQQLLATVLAFAPPIVRTPPDFELLLATAEVVSGGDGDVQLIAYDSRGEVIGVIALWTDTEGRVHLASDYSDGYAEAIYSDDADDAVLEASLPPHVIAKRAELMLEAIRESPGETRGVLSCAASAVGGAALCQPGLGPWIVATCPTAIVIASCECFPLVGLHNPCEA